MWLKLLIVYDQFNKVRVKEKWSEVKVEAKKRHQQCFFQLVAVGGKLHLLHWIQALRQHLSGIVPEVKGDTNAASDVTETTKANFQ